MSSMRNYDKKDMQKRKDGSIRIKTVDFEKTRTQNQFKDQCDVNKIVAKYKTTGEWTHLTQKGGVYADVSNITDYQESMQKIVTANAAFDSLPSDMRLRFANDPGQLLNFLQDPKNYDEGVKLGLLQKRPEPSPEPQKQNDLNEQKPAKGKKPDSES